MKPQIRYEGDPQVLVSLFRKHYLLERGDVSHQYLRTAVCAGSGVMRGVFAGGAGRALHRFGLSHAFDVAVGVSTGAPGIGFFLAGQLDPHLDIYWNEGASEKFISFKALWKGGRPIADTDFLMRVFRSKMDQEAVRRSRTKFYVGATCAKTGEGHLIDAKAVQPDILEAVHASIALPKLAGRTVKIDDVEYVDGAAGRGTAFPARKMVEMFKPTDLLLFANCPHEDKNHWADNLLSHWITSEFSESFRKAYFNRHQDFLDDVNYLRIENPCRWAIVWSDDSVGRFERDVRKLPDAADRAQRHFESLLYDARRSLEQNPLAAQ